MWELICFILALIVIIVLAKHSPEPKDDSEDVKDDDSDYSTWILYDDD